MIADRVPDHLPHIDPPVPPRAANNWSGQRLQSPWLYRGADAARVANITPGQANYAMTLRRQLVDGLAKTATQHAASNTAAEGLEWAGIAAACRRELRRTERAMAKLAEGPHA